MSQAQTEENVNVERATRFFEALSAYFKQDPKTVSGLLHVIANSLIDVIDDNEELKKELGLLAGELRVTSHLIWYHDEKEVIQQKLTEPATLENVMDAIAKIAKAYAMLKSGENTSLEEVGDLIGDASSTFYKIIESLVIGSDSDEDP